MRIVISGTHASGKSTLISDFALRHPDFTVLPDPYELTDEADDAPSAGSFSAQLRFAAARLDPAETPGSIIAERGPLDFLAYLLAWEQLTGGAYGGGGVPGTRCRDAPRSPRARRPARGPATHGG